MRGEQFKTGNSITEAGWLGRAEAQFQRFPLRHNGTSEYQQRWPAEAKLEKNEMMPGMRPGDSLKVFEQRHSEG